MASGCNSNAGPVTPSARVKAIALWCRMIGSSSAVFHTRESLRINSRKSSRAAIRSDRGEQLQGNWGCLRGLTCVLGKGYIEILHRLRIRIGE